MNRLVILGQSKRMDCLCWGRDNALTGFNETEYEWTGYTGTKTLNVNHVTVPAGCFLGIQWCVYLCVFGCPVVAVNMQTVEVERPRQLLGLRGKHAAAIFTFVTTASFHSHSDSTNTFKC